MPAQSIASYISNLSSLGIMILIALFLFLVIFVISKLLIKANLRGRTQDGIKENKNTGNKTVILNKDPNILVNLAALGIFFLIFIIFILLVLFFLIFNELMTIKISMYFIIFVLIFIIVASVYILKSKIFR
ncbi:MAG: hypothetical protein ACYCXK_04830 [Candidatus Humimicrobiaceae bacterium]